MANFNLKRFLKGKKVQDGLDAKVEKVVTAWKSFSPEFGDRPPHRDAPAHGAKGDYKKSITVVDHPDGDVPGKRVQTTDFKAKWIEFGTAHMPTYAPRAKTRAKFR